jgi:hypothetical protein
MMSEDQGNYVRINTLKAEIEQLRKFKAAFAKVPQEQKARIMREVAFDELVPDEIDHE